MHTKKQLGIWMDHTSADLIDILAVDNDHTISLNFDFEAKVEALHKSESLMQNKEQQKHETFYKKIGKEILTYSHILIFGPTNAKTELYNYLHKDLHFKDIIFDILPADKMTKNQKEAFVKKHFNGHHD